MKKMNKKGFTIVELVIVIAVIAILAAVMIPTFSGIVDKAQMSATLQKARNYYTEIYADDLVDGELNGKNNDLPATAPNNEGTYYPNGDYELKDGKWIAKFNKATNEWTVEESVNPS